MLPVLWTNCINYLDGVSRLDGSEVRDGHALGDEARLGLSVAEHDSLRVKNNINEAALTLQELLFEHNMYACIVLKVCAN